MPKNNSTPHTQDSYGSFGPTTLFTEVIGHQSIPKDKTDKLRRDFENIELEREKLGFWVHQKMGALETPYAIKIDQSSQ